ncbi:hypothetical protein SDC9_124143 [bioreactor metagenome]|uniref:Uncharacterized protein n=1 Tax=bioreactor metagenome TaxID=1076179 RepID=A0A645CJP2_9ZZZZ
MIHHKVEHKAVCFLERMDIGPIPEGGIYNNRVYYRKSVIGAGWVKGENMNRGNGSSDILIQEGLQNGQRRFWIIRQYRICIGDQDTGMLFERRYIHSRNFIKGSAVCFQGGAKSISISLCNTISIEFR